MGLDMIPTALRKKYTFGEWHHACAVLAIDFPQEFKDLMNSLRASTLKKERDHDSRHAEG